MTAQQTYVASLICDDQVLRHDDPDQPIPTHTTIVATPGNEPYAIAGTADGSQPSARHRLQLDQPPADDELRMWQQRAVRAEIDLAIGEMDAYWEHHGLGDAKIARATARVRELRDRLARLEGESVAARAAHDAIVHGSSWRITEPLRRLARRI